MTFQEEIITNFLPSLNRMLVKEKEHLVFLHNSKVKGKIFVDLAAEKFLNDAIERSEGFIKHLELRISQYEKFAES